MKKKSLKILSYNIHKGLHWSGMTAILFKIKMAIKSTKADIVCLQEVVGQHESKRYHAKLATQFETLADTQWPHYAYGKNAIYPKGHHGNAILSKYPIKFFDNFDISTNALEQRGLLHAQIAIPFMERPLDIYTTHINLTTNGRKKQFSKIVDIIQLRQKRHDPLIICGDFNDWDQQAYHCLERPLDITDVFSSLYKQYAPTFPAFWPTLTLDRIYFRNMLLRHASTKKHHFWKHLSDHIPLYAEFLMGEKHGK